MKARSGGRKRNRFPWLLLLALLASIYLFWVLPRQLAPKPIEMKFDQNSR